LITVPENFAKPKITSLSSTVIRVDWSPPLVLNGPPPVYSVQKTETSLSFPPNVIQGTFMILIFINKIRVKCFPFS
jgi:hypothetical protein